MEIDPPVSDLRERLHREFKLSFDGFYAYGEGVSIAQRRCYISRDFM